RSCNLEQLARVPRDWKFAANGRHGAKRRRGFSRISRHIEFALQMRRPGEGGLGMNIQDQSRFASRAGVPGLVPGYMSGFGNSFETEALAGALPIGRNSPQKVNFGLYAEQLSGSAFTAPQDTNQRSWLYRIRPTVKHSTRYRKIDKGLIRTAPAAREESDLPIGQVRWGPIPIPDEKLTFAEGLRTMTTAGDAETRAGMAAHVLLVTASKGNEYFFDADGELLVVAQQNKLRFRTEFGV